MARPSKAAPVIKLEKKSHRTKKELAAREKAESALLTGKMMIETAEVKNDRTAHLEFLRLKPLLKAIDKFDEIYGAATRRYCLNKSKLNEIEEDIEKTKNEIEEIRGNKSDFSKNMPEYYRLVTKMEDIVAKKEGLAKAIRAEMNDFEKQNCMTIRSALAAIPKKSETKANALKEALGV